MKNGWYATWVALCIGAALLPAPAQGQSTRATSRDSVTLRSNTLLRVSKWTLLAASAGAAAYGFSANRTADKDYATLEQMCVADRENCLRREGGAYVDADLEKRYQDVRSLDHKARFALVGSQVGVAATVVLFVMDLRHARPPKDIPYNPRAVEILPGVDGGLQLRLSLPLPLDQRQH